MQLAIDAQLGRAARGHVQIARALLDHRLEQLMKIRHSVS
jgi:hypothetical protein